LDLKAVIFDYGEVLSYPPTTADTAQLAGFFGASVDRLPALWEKNRGPYDRGDLTPEVYWSMLAQDAGIQIDQKRLDEISALDLAMWSNINSSMVEWMHRLSSAGMKVGLLSNMQPTMVAHCRRQFAWINDFDFATFSGEVRMIKPDAAIYDYTLNGLGAKAAETLFLDDRERNIEAAKALGIHALRFHSVEQLRGELKQIGFKIFPQD